ncbi:MAG: hypothetical protein HQ557_04540 [Bacteroidetes bacterium]|nr:hypothetical protein [Bacteroidota bacterium]
MKKDYQQISGSLFVSQNTNLMISSLVVFWFFAMIFFAEPYKFWQFSISSLGSTVTPNGYTNRTSVLMFIMSMAAAFSIMWRLARFYRLTKSVNYKIYAFLYYWGSIGTVVICYPSNISNPIHSIGGGLLVFSHVFITLTHILAQKKLISMRQFVLRIVTLSIPVLAYAFLWLILETPIVQFFQKIAFIILFMLEKRTTRADLISLEQNLFVNRSDEDSRYIYLDTKLG